MLWCVWFAAPQNQLVCVHTKTLEETHVKWLSNSSSHQERGKCVFSRITCICQPPEGAFYSLAIGEIRAQTPVFHLEMDSIFGTGGKWRLRFKICQEFFLTDVLSFYPDSSIRACWKDPRDVLGVRISMGMAVNVGVWGGNGGKNGWQLVRLRVTTDLNVRTPPGQVWTQHHHHLPLLLICLQKQNLSSKHLLSAAHRWPRIKSV